MADPVPGLGRNTLVSANWDLPWARELRSILVQTVGVLGRLAEALRTARGIREAFVFGSWAARHGGEPEPPPRDIDVLVIGDASLRSVRQACRPLEAQLRVDVNPVVVDVERSESADPDPFLVQVRSEPLAAIPLDAR
jgi:predicted nucleotidyltransferase